MLSIQVDALSHPQVFTRTDPRACSTPDTRRQKAILWECNWIHHSTLKDLLWYNSHRKPHHTLFRTLSLGPSSCGERQSQLVSQSIPVTPRLCSIDLAEARDAGRDRWAGFQTTTEGSWSASKPNLDVWNAVADTPFEYKRSAPRRTKYHPTFLPLHFFLPFLALCSGSSEQVTFDDDAIALGTSGLVVHGELTAHDVALLLH